MFIADHNTLWLHSERGEIHISLPQYISPWQAHGLDQAHGKCVPAEVANCVPTRGVCRLRGRALCAVVHTHQR